MSLKSTDNIKKEMIIKSMYYFLMSPWALPHVSNAKKIMVKIPLQELRSACKNIPQCLQRHWELSI